MTTRKRLRSLAQGKRLVDDQQVQNSEQKEPTERRDEESVVAKEGLLSVDEVRGVDLLLRSHDGHNPNKIGRLVLHH